MSQAQKVVSTVYLARGKHWLRGSCCRCSLRPVLVSRIHLPVSSSGRVSGAAPLESEPGLQSSECVLLGPLGRGICSPVISVSFELFTFAIRIPSIHILIHFCSDSDPLIFALIHFLRTNLLSTLTRCQIGFTVVRRPGRSSHGLGCRLRVAALSEPQRAWACTPTRWPLGRCWCYFLKRYSGILIGILVSFSCLFGTVSFHYQVKTYLNSEGLTLNLTQFTLTGSASDRANAPLQNIGNIKKCKTYELLHSCSVQAGWHKIERDYYGRFRYVFSVLGFRRNQGSYWKSHILNSCFPWCTF